MDEFVETWLDCSGLAESTREQYGYEVHRFGEWLASRHKTFDTFTVQEFTKFLSGNGWSHNSQRQYACAIRGFMRWLGREDHGLFDCKLAKDDSLPGRSLDELTLQDLLESFDTSTPLGRRDLAMACIIAETGLRAAEICRLEMSRLDLRAQHFVVLAKGGKAREGVISNTTLRFVNAWLECRSEIARPGVRTVFVSVGGRRPGTSMTSHGLRSLYRRFGRRAGIGYLSPHDLRRTMAMLLTEAHAPTRLVQVLGAWDDVRMVERYTRKLKAQQINAFSPIHRSYSDIKILPRA
jgi:site-specific recombinase XerD